MLTPEVNKKWALFSYCTSDNTIDFTLTFFTLRDCSLPRKILFFISSLDAWIRTSDARRSDHWATHPSQNNANTITSILIKKLQITVMLCWTFQIFFLLLKSAGGGSPVTGRLFSITFDNTMGTQGAVFYRNQSFNS